MQKRMAISDVIVGRPRTLSEDFDRQYKDMTGANSWINSLRGANDSQQHFNNLNDRLTMQSTEGVPQTGMYESLITGIAAGAASDVTTLNPAMLLGGIGATAKSAHRGKRILEGAARAAVADAPISAGLGQLQADGGGSEAYTALDAGVSAGVAGLFGGLSGLMSKGGVGEGSYSPNVAERTQPAGAEPLGLPHLAPDGTPIRPAPEGGEILGLPAPEGYYDMGPPAPAHIDDPHSPLPSVPDPAPIPDPNIPPPAPIPDPNIPPPAPIPDPNVPDAAPSDHGIPTLTDVVAPAVPLTPMPPHNPADVAGIPRGAPPMPNFGSPQSYDNGAAVGMPPDFSGAATGNASPAVPLTPMPPHNPADVAGVPRGTPPMPDFGSPQSYDSGIPIGMPPNFSGTLADTVAPPPPKTPEANVPAPKAIPEANVPPPKAIPEANVPPPKAIPDPDVPPPKTPEAAPKPEAAAPEAAAPKPEAAAPEAAAPKPEAAEPEAAAPKPEPAAPEPAAPKPEPAAPEPAAPEPAAPEAAAPAAAPAAPAAATPPKKKPKRPKRSSQSEADMVAKEDAADADIGRRYRGTLDDNIQDSDHGFVRNTAREIVEAAKRLRVAAKRMREDKDAPSALKHSAEDLIDRENEVIQNGQYPVGKTNRKGKRPAHLIPLSGDIRKTVENYYDKEIAPSFAKGIAAADAQTMAAYNALREDIIETLTNIALAAKKGGGKTVSFSRITKRTKKGTSGTSVSPTSTRRGAGRLTITRIPDTARNEKDLLTDVASALDTIVHEFTHSFGAEGLIGKSLYREYLHWFADLLEDMAKNPDFVDTNLGKGVVGTTFADRISATLFGYTVEHGRVKPNRKFMGINIQDNPDELLANLMGAYARDKMANNAAGWLSSAKALIQNIWESVLGIRSSVTAPTANNLADMLPPRLHQAFSGIMNDDGGYFKSFASKGGAPTTVLSILSGTSKASKNADPIKVKNSTTDKGRHGGREPDGDRLSFVPFPNDPVGQWADDTIDRLREYAALYEKPDSFLLGHTPEELALRENKLRDFNADASAWPLTVKEPATADSPHIFDLTKSAADLRKQAEKYINEEFMPEAREAATRFSGEFDIDPDNPHRATERMEDIDTRVDYLSIMGPEFAETIGNIVVAAKKAGGKGIAMSRIVKGKGTRQGATYFLHRAEGETRGAANGAYSRVDFEDKDKKTDEAFAARVTNTFGVVVHEMTHAFGADGLLGAKTYKEYLNWYADMLEEIKDHPELQRMHFRAALEGYLFGFDINKWGFAIPRRSFPARNVSDNPDELLANIMDMAAQDKMKGKLDTWAKKARAMIEKIYDVVFGREDISDAYSLRDMMPENLYNAIDGIINDNGKYKKSMGGGDGATPITTKEVFDERAARTIITGPASERNIRAATKEVATPAALEKTLSKTHSILGKGFRVLLPKTFADLDADKASTGTVSIYSKTRALVSSVRQATTSALKKLHNKPDLTESQKSTLKVLDDLVHDIMGGNNKGGRVGAPAYERKLGQRITAYVNKINKRVTDLQKASGSADKVREALQGKSVKLTRQEAAAAKHIRKILDQVADEHGLPKRKDYFPRELLRDKIAENLTDFGQKMGDVYTKMVANGAILHEGTLLHVDDPSKLDYDTDAYKSPEDYMEQARKDALALDKDAIATMGSAYASHVVQDDFSLKRASELGQTTGSQRDTSGPTDVYGKLRESKQRTLGPEFDEIMGDYYEQDVHKALSGYMTRVIHKGTVREYLSDTSGATMNKLFSAVARESGNADALAIAADIAANPHNRGRAIIAIKKKIAKNDAELAEQLVAIASDNNKLSIALRLSKLNGLMSDADAKATDDMFSSVMNMQRDEAGQISTVANVLTAYSYVRLLGRLFLTSVAEPMVAAARLPNSTLGTGVKGILKSAAAFAKTDEDGVAVAEMLGIVTNAQNEALIDAMTGTDIYGRGSAARRAVSRYMEGIGVLRLTNAQRTTSMRMVIDTLDNPKLGDEGFLRDVGIGDIKAARREIDDLLKREGLETDGTLWQKFKRLADADASAHSTQLGSAVQQFVDTAIQNPTRADKPYAASTPIGRLVYGLTSFQFAFHENILKGSVNRVKSDGGNYSAVHLASMAASLVAIHMATNALRQEVFNKEKEEPADVLDLAIAGVLGSGVVGSASIPIAAMLSTVNYGAPLSANLAGVGINTLLSDVGKVLQVMSGQTNSGNRAAQAIYSGAVAPAISMALIENLTGKGAIGTAIPMLAVPILSSSRASENVADLVVPPEK